MTEKNTVQNETECTPAKLVALCVEMAEDRKAENVIALDVSAMSTIADYFVLCTGNSEPHLRAITDRAAKEIKDQFKVLPRAVEGSPASQWVLLDFGAVVMHVMTPEMRDNYQLESLWGDAPRVEAVKKLEEVCKA